jgi:hypothetical protein
VVTVGREIKQKQLAAEGKANVVRRKRVEVKKPAILEDDDD